MPKHSTDLTAKEAAFIVQYLVDGNGARAAKDAGYSMRTAGRIASELMTKPHIKAAINKALKEQEKRTLISADANLRRLDRLAQKAEGECDWQAAIAASAWIGKHYKSFTDKLEVRDTTPRADRLAAARARRQQQVAADE